MNSKMNLLIVGSIIAVFAIMMVPNDAIAEIDQNNINVRQINDKMSLEITTVTMTVPENNKLPWGKVWGSSSEVVEVGVGVRAFNSSFRFFGTGLMSRELKSGVKEPRSLSSLLVSSS